jgi:hypothetical protein
MAEAPKTARRMTRRTSGGRSRPDDDRPDPLNPLSEAPAPPIIQFTDVGFADYQKLVIRQLEDIAKRVEKMQKALCRLDATVRELELCDVHPMSDSE